MRLCSKQPFAEAAALLHHGTFIKALNHFSADEYGYRQKGGVLFGTPYFTTKFINTKIKKDSMTAKGESNYTARSLWRVRYPWILAVYILVFSVLTAILKLSSNDPEFIINLLFLAGLTSYVFLYIFYIFGVRPIELEHHFRKKK